MKNGKIMKTIIFLSIFSFSSIACVQKGVIRTVTVNDNYAWFKLENGFNLRLVQKSPFLPLLLAAMASGSEVCAMDMNLGATGPSWGIPKKVLVNL